MPETFASSTPNGIGFEELPDSPKIRINPKTGIQATRIFRINWDDWGAFARELLGVVSLVGGQQLSASPFGFPEVPYLVIDDFSIDPMMGDSPDGTHPVTLSSRTNSYPGGAKITVSYVSVDRNKDANRPGVPDGTYLTVSEDLGADYVTLQGRSWVWDGGDDDGKKVADDANVGVIMPTGQTIMTWSRVSSPPRAAIRDKRGRVNNATWCGYAAGTLLFLGAKINRQFQILEDSGLYQIEYTFAESVNGWNKQWNPKRGVWTAIKANDSSDPPYLSTTFDELFQFA